MDSNLTAYHRTFPISINGLVTGRLCRIHATVSESIDLKTGDQIDQITIDEIIDTTGQVVHPIALSPHQFRTLVQNIKRYIPEV